MTPKAKIVTAVLLAASMIAPQAAQAGSATSSTHAHLAAGHHAQSPAVVLHPDDRAVRRGPVSGTAVAVVRPDDRATRLGPGQGGTASAPAVVVRTSPVGFDWASAAIGALAAFGLSIIGVAAVSTRRRPARSLSV